jgi:hypothetical protein
MDERLKEVRQTDITEGRINEDFLDWLRTKGVSWLLVLMVALCVYFGILRWRNHKLNFEAEGWTPSQRQPLPDRLKKLRTSMRVSTVCPLLLGFERHSS